MMRLYCRLVFLALTTCWLLPVFAEGGTPIAQINVYEGFVERLKLTGKETKHFVEDGAYVVPNINFSVTPSIVTAKNWIRMKLNVHVSGRAVGTASQNVTRRIYAGASVGSDLNARLYQSFYLTPDGVSVGKNLFGSIDIQMHPPVTFNNVPHGLFGIARRVAHRKTAKIARKQAAQKIPAKKADLKKMVSQSARNGIQKANRTYRRFLSELQSMTFHPKALSYQMKFASQKQDSKHWGYLQVSLSDSSKKKRAVRPTPKKKYQRATSFFLHEDALEQTLAPLLAGKQLRLSTVKDIVCRQEFGKLLDFCREKLDSVSAQVSILFSEDNPIDFTFDNNQIGIRFNAIHQVHKKTTKIVRKRVPILTGPTKKTELLYQGLPYSIDILYDLKGDHAVRKHVRITPVDLAATAKKNGEHSAISALTKRVGSLFTPIEKMKLQSAYSKAFKTRVDYSPVSFPIGFHIDNPKDKSPPNMTTAASLVPLESRTSGGWLYGSSYYCQQENPPLGVTTTTVHLANGERRLKVSSVFAGSPADFSYYRAGDQITGFRLASSQELIPVTNHADFARFISQAAAQKQVSGREIVLVGIDRLGRSFQAPLTLCPTWIDHRDRATRLLGKLSN